MIWFKWKKSDLNQRNPILIFSEEIMIFSNPVDYFISDTNFPL